MALADIFGDDTRIGRRFLDAGIGFGGGCLPKDIRGFSARATQLGAESAANLLHLQGAHVRVYDPEAGDNARAASPALTHVDSVEAALTGADLVLHLTDWPEFLSLDPYQVADLVRRRRIVDGRNRLDQSLWADAGWLLRGIGRSPQAPQARPLVGHATASYAVEPLADPAGSHGSFAEPAYRLLERT